MNLLEMSFFGAVMIIAIVVARVLAVNRLPKRVFLILWGLVLLRLLVPFSIPSALSIYSFINRSMPARNDVIEVPVADVVPQAVTAPVKIYEGVASAMQNEGPDISIRLVIWTAGMLLCAGYFLISYFRCRREFRISLPVRNAYVNEWLQQHRLKRTIRIRQSDRISAPLTYGVFNPVILMPKKTDWENRHQLEYVLMHEYIHIRRFDMVFKLIATFALCIHWFNPLVWVMYFLYNRDIELACDEGVVHRFGDDSKSTYAMTLITMEEKRSGLTPLCNNFSKNAIEERITAIMKTKKLTYGLVTVSAAVIVAIVVLFTTSAKSEEVSQNLEEGIIEESVEASGTVLEMAKEYVSEKYSNMQDSGYCNWKIETLSHVYTYDDLEGMTVQIYQMNYKFLAENPKNVVLVGGMIIDEEGWVIPEYANSTFFAVVQDGGALSCQVLVENDCFPGDEVFTEDLRQQLKQMKDDSRYLKIIKADEKKITKQIADIIGEAESVRYVLENCELEIGSVEGNRVDCTFWADWISIREPEDDPLIQGLYQAVEALSDNEEKEHAMEIADGWLAELQSWPENERLNTEIAILLDNANSWELYYKYVMDGQEELIPLQEYARENWTENERERRQQGIDIIDEAVRLFRNPNGEMASNSGRENSITIQCLVEGMPEEIPATLYVGDGFSIYIPDEDWIIYDETLEAPAKMTAVWSSEVSVWVEHYKDESFFDVEGRLLAEGYAYDTNVEKLQKFDGNILTEARLAVHANDVWAVFSMHNAAYELGSRLDAIAETFAVTGNPDEISAAGTVPMENGEVPQIVKDIMVLFYTAYFDSEGDAGKIKPYLSESFAYDVELYHEIAPDSTIYSADDLVVRGIKTQAYESNGTVGDKCILSLEFCFPDEDSLTYLTVEFVRESAGWKIASYGLEK